jgi:hypothetical protein
MIDAALLCGHWVHSHEEDDPNTLVYRPREFPFPRSRGRHAFELRSDGTGTEFPLAPADGSAERPARWTLTPDGSVRLTSPDGAVLRVLKVREAKKDKLSIAR